MEHPMWDAGGSSWMSQFGGHDTLLVHLQSNNLANWNQCEQNINMYISETEQLTLYIEYSLADIEIQAAITG